MNASAGLMAVEGAVDPVQSAGLEPADAPVTTASVDIAQTADITIATSPIGARPSLAHTPLSARLQDRTFRARVVTPVMFMGMILVPSAVLAGIALFGSDSNAVQHSSPESATAVVAADG